MLEVVVVADRVDNREKKIRRSELHDILIMLKSMQTHVMQNPAVAANADPDDDQLPKKNIRKMIPFDRDEDIKDFFLLKENVRGLGWFFRTLTQTPGLANAGLLELLTQRYMTYHIWSDKNVG